MLLTSGESFAGLHKTSLAYSSTQRKSSVAGAHGLQVDLNLPFAE